MRRLAAVVLVSLSAGCSDRASPPREIELVPRRTPSADGGPRTDTQVVGTTRGTPCARQWPAQVQLRGVLQREVHLGPPGYGETPEQDRRDTIPVLVLPAPIPVCPDSEAHGASDGAIKAERLQLTGRVAPALDHLGDTVTVYGVLEERSWGWHYTRVVIRVDSIPKLRSRPRPSQTAAILTTDRLSLPG